VQTSFISHPFSSDPIGNGTAVKRIARQLVSDGRIPLAPQIYLPLFIDEATERNLALDLCLALVAMSDEVRVYGEPSEGMRREIAEARRLGIPVVDGETGERLLPKEGPPR
jgi:hypothetical protein